MCQRLNKIILFIILICNISFAENLSVKEYEKRCYDKNAAFAYRIDDCIKYAFSYLDGKNGAKKNISKGLDIFKNVCNRTPVEIGPFGNAIGCSILGKLYEDISNKNYVKKDIKLAEFYYKKAFEFDQVGENGEDLIRLYYEQGRYKELQDLAEKRCDISIVKLFNFFPSGCLHLGLIYNYGINGYQNTHLAKTFLEIGCDADNKVDSYREQAGLACMFLAEIYEDEKKDDKAKEYYKKACKKGVEESCNKAQ